jgi:hypothetical protein
MYHMMAPYFYVVAGDGITTYVRCMLAAVLCYVITKELVDAVLKKYFEGW